jgi:hypothetical protein
MMISGIQLNVQGQEKYLTQVTKSEIGLYQINNQMLEWAENLTDELQTHPVRPIPRQDVLSYYSRDREWVNDDTLLIAKCIEDCEHLGVNTQVALVSRDKRLANQMAISANVIVVLVDPRSLATCLPNVVWNSTTEITPQELYDQYFERETFKGLQVPYRVYLDTGSIFSALHNVEVEEENMFKYMYEHTLVEAGVREGTRYEIVDRSKLPLTLFARTRKYDPSYARSGKKKKSSTYSDDSSSRFTWSESTVTFNEYIIRRNASTFHKKSG